MVKQRQFDRRYQAGRGLRGCIITVSIRPILFRKAIRFLTRGIGRFNDSEKRRCYAVKNRHGRTGLADRGNCVYLDMAGFRLRWRDNGFLRVRRWKFILLMLKWGFLAPPGSYSGFDRPRPQRLSKNHHERLMSLCRVRRGGIFQEESTRCRRKF